MENVVIRMDNGDVLEFLGTQVASATREVVHDGRRSTVFEYRLFRTEEGALVLALETYEKVRARSFFLRFNAEADVRDYVRRDPGGEAVAAELLAEDE